MRVCRRLVLIVPFAFAACQLDGEAAGPDTLEPEAEVSMAEARPTAFTFGAEPGALTIDASEVRIAFPLPTAIREFDNWDAFADFAVKELNAQRIVDPVTGAVTVRGSLSLIDVPVYPDGSGDLVPIDDPIVAYLGGTAGIVRIAGKDISLRDDAPQPRENRTMSQCDHENDFCIQGDAWVSHYAIYHQVGSATTQTVGGTYSSWYYGCPSWPWVCWTTMNSNHLYVEQTMMGPYYQVTRRAEGTNVSQVVALEYLFGYGTGMDDPVASADSNCTYHSGSGSGGSTAFPWGLGTRCNLP